MPYTKLRVSSWLGRSVEFKPLLSTISKKLSHSLFNFLQNFRLTDSLFDVLVLRKVHYLSSTSLRVVIGGVNDDTSLLLALANTPLTRRQPFRQHPANPPPTLPQESPRIQEIPRYLLTHVYIAVVNCVLIPRHVIISPRQSKKQKEKKEKPVLIER